MASPLALFSVDSTLGAGLVGYSASLVLFGVLSLQTFYYFQRYPLDRPLYKVLVFALWVLEFFHEGLVAHVIYFYVITNYMSPQVLLLENVVWTLIVQIIIGAVVGSLVKACFALRVWRFSGHNLWVTGGLMTIIVCQFGASTWFAVRCFQLGKIKFLDDLKVIASCSLSLSAVADIATAVALTFYLRRMRTGYSGTDTMVKTLTIYAINTGAVTSAFSIVTMVLYNIYNMRNFFFMAFFFVLIKLYAISFMCTLNTRRVSQGRGTDRERTTNATGGNVFLVHPQGSPTSQMISQPSSVHVHQEVWVKSDAAEAQPRYPPKFGVAY